MRKNIKKYIDIVFVILREQNLGHKDIDHILPFLYFLSKSDVFDYKATGLVLENEANYKKNTDPRVNLLANLKNVNLKFLYDDNFFSKIKELSELRGTSTLTKIFKSILNRIYLNQLKKRYKKLDLKSKLGEFFLKSKSPIVITLHANDEAQEIVSRIKKLNKKAKWIVLPDGTTICDNKMVVDTNLEQNDDKNLRLNYKRYKELDFLLQTSNRDLQDAISSGLDNVKGFVIGSPRFSRDWLEVKTKLKLDGKNVIKNNKYKVKILFLIPKRHINIFNEELVRTIDFISSYNEIELALLNYNFNYPSLPIYIKSRPNLTQYLISKDYSTSKLIDWADIVFHVGTGVIFESFIKEKITVLPRYLSSNTLISEKYNAGFNLKNRDDLRTLCNSAVKSLKMLKSHYKKKCGVSNEKFINDFINANSKSVKKNIEKKLLKICNSF